MAVYRVIGSGIPEINTDYIENGSQNSRPIFVSGDGLYKLYYTNLEDAWAIAPVSEQNLHRYLNYDPAMTPPSSGWEVSTYGVTPAPTAALITEPFIISFSPASGPVATIVTITGVNFSGATQVLFNGVSTTNFTINSDASITVTVPSGATTG